MRCVWQRVFFMRKHILCRKSKKKNFFPPWMLWCDSTVDHIQILKSHSWMAMQTLKQEKVSQLHTQLKFYWFGRSAFILVGPHHQSQTSLSCSDSTDSVCKKPSLMLKPEISVNYMWKSYLLKVNFSVSYFIMTRHDTYLKDVNRTTLLYVWESWTWGLTRKKSIHWYFGKISNVWRILSIWMDSWK